MHVFIKIKKERERDIDKAKLKLLLKWKNEKIKMLKLIEITICRTLPTLTIRHLTSRTNETDIIRTNSSSEEISNFTSCQEQVLFTWLPCFTLAILSPFWLYTLFARTSKFNTIKITWISITRLVTLATLILNQLAHMANLITTSSRNTHQQLASLELISSLVLSTAFVIFSNFIKT
jgi:hypothetical protein